MRHPALRALAQKIKSIPVQDLLEEAAAQTRQQAADLQREQMMDGEDSEGNAIEPFYTQFTIREKRKKGQPTDRVTLKDTGSFHQQVFAEAEDKGIQFGSRDSKTKEIKAKYGPVFGLNKVKARRYSREDILPILQKGVYDWFKSK